MGDTKALERAAAIEGFAAELQALRDAAGRPSFRVMSGRSRIISHTTLHEAAQGNRLPSWGTTVEFVKACGADPADYRERWERASRAVCPGGAGGSAGEAAPALVLPVAAPGRARIDVAVHDAEGGPDVELREGGAGDLDLRDLAGPEPAEPDVVEGGRGVPARGSQRRRLGAAVLAVVLLAALAGVGRVAWQAWSDDDPAATAPGAAQGFAASDCPVHQANPAPAPPTHAGDRAAFVADMTLPDCAHVARGRAVQKVWRLKNAGTVPWVGYTMHRIDLPQTRDSCQTIPDVPVPDTEPGQLVDVTVEVSVPAHAAFCFVRFKLTDGRGAVAFPGGRPVNFQLVVD